MPANEHGGHQQFQDGSHVIGTNEVRASDADRAGIAERVSNAAAEGRLTMDEADERLGAVYAARYESELNRLVVDLPVQQPKGPAYAGRPRAAMIVGAVVLSAFVVSGIVHAAVGDWNGPHFPWPLLIIAFVAWRFGAFARWNRSGDNGRSRVSR
ncbi:MAG: DUF1707 SHOCT-like domain-containing protein [Mycobacteriales bacterium]